MQREYILPPLLASKECPKTLLIYSTNNSINFNTDRVSFTSLSMVDSKNNTVGNVPKDINVCNT